MEDECFQAESDETLKSFFKKGTQKTMNQELENRESVTRALCRFLYSEAFPFNFVKGPLRSSVWVRGVVANTAPGVWLELSSARKC